MTSGSLIERIVERYASAPRYADRGTARVSVGDDTVAIDLETSSGSRASVEGEITGDAGR